MNVHTLNTILFYLAAKLECIAIHTCGPVCDGAGENRRHIKSFDWYASIWKVNDKVEVQWTNKSGKKHYRPARIISFNFARTEFLVQLSGTSQTYSFSCSALRPPMPEKMIWNVNDRCEVRNTNSNNWYPGKVLTKISVDNYLDIEVTIETTGKVELYIWKSLLHDIRPAYDENEHFVSHLAINPITGDKWFFLNDSTHVFKKLRNNVSKSHTSNNENENIREIMFNGWEISWRHFQGVYEHTTKHEVAKATKLTKRHIWLTPWSKMRVDLAEHILSFDVKKAMENIPELNYISQGTQVRNLILF
jgi:hypothetical protein